MLDMLASLQSFVKSPVSIDTWKMFCNIGASWTAHSLSILLGILSGFLVALYHRNLGVLILCSARRVLCCCSQVPLSCFYLCSQTLPSLDDVCILFGTLYSLSIYCVSLLAYRASVFS
jgi:hypothetical protein